MKQQSSSNLFLRTWRERTENRPEFSKCPGVVLPERYAVDIRLTSFKDCFSRAPSGAYAPVLFDLDFVRLWFIWMDRILRRRACSILESFSANRNVPGELLLFFEFRSSYCALRHSTHLFLARGAHDGRSCPLRALLHEGFSIHVSGA